MIKKMLCLFFCMLMLIIVFPISGFSQQTGEINSLIINSNPQEQTTSEVPSVATPGYMPIPSHPPVITKTVPSHPYVTISSTNDDVIQMIEEIDDSVILGYLEGLTAFGPRVTETSECIDAAEYIYNEYESMGLDVSYYSWSLGGYSSNDVVATLNGTDTDSDEIYIVCGHYDSVSESPGADDDGSGTITAMAAAYVMSHYTFEHTIRFIAWSGEEEGLLGSQAYAAEASANGENIAGVLNADMIGFATIPGDENSLKIYEDTASEWLYTFTSDVNDIYDQYINLDLVHSGYTWGSDHNSFWDYGYDALFYQEYHFSNVYHSPQDTIENMNIPYTVKGVKLITATLAELAVPKHINTAPSTPTITGTNSGKPLKDYFYQFSSTDPENDKLYYYVDWGDGNIEDWFGSYNSGEKASATHNWSEKGTYTIKVKAKDFYGLESGFATLMVTMPREKIVNRPIIQLIEDFIKNHPDRFPILLNLLNRLEK